MSPPIRDGSGNSIGSVRLGDGTEISEIRTGAGDVLFSAIDIPDSGNLHADWDLREQQESDGESISTLTDQTENGNDLPAVGSPTMNIDGFGGLPQADLDGVDDGFRGTTEFSDLSTPFSIYAVIQPVGENDSQYVLRNGNNDFLIRDASSGYRTRLNSGNLVDISTGTTDVLAGFYSNSEQRTEIDLGETTSSGSGQSGTLSEFTIGFRGGDNDLFEEMKFTRYLVYDNFHDSDTRNDIYDYIKSTYPV